MKQILDICKSRGIFRSLWLDNDGKLKFKEPTGYDYGLEVKEYRRLTFFREEQNGAKAFLAIDTIPVQADSVEAILKISQDRKSADLRVPIRAMIWNEGSYALMSFQITVGANGAINYKKLALRYNGELQIPNKESGSLENDFAKTTFQFKGNSVFMMAAKSKIPHRSNEPDPNAKRLKFRFEEQDAIFCPVLAREFFHEFLEERQIWGPFGVVVNKKDFRALPKLSEAKQILVLPASEDEEKKLPSHGLWAVEWQVPPRAFWRYWSERIEIPYQRSLLMVQDAGSASFLPRVTNLNIIPVVRGNNAAVWNGARLSQRVLDAGDFVRPLTEDDVFGFTTPEDFSRPWQNNEQLRIADWFLCPSPKVGEAIPLELTEIQDHTGETLRCPWRLNSTRPSKVASHPIVRIDLGPLDLGDARQTVRMGALDLVFGGKVLTTDPTFVEVVLVPNAAFSEGRVPRLDAKFVLPLRSVLPGGQDSIPGEDAVPINALDATATKLDFEIEKGFRREAPLILLTEPLPELTHDKVTLQVTEATRDGLSHTLRMQIHSQQKAAENAKVSRAIVLDRQPFTVAQVLVPPLTTQDPVKGTSEVANWSNRGVEGSVWEIAGSTEGFALMLPPQTVGEEMEKRKSVEEGHKVQYQFAPQARLQLQSSYFRQRYAEAPWNLRRILGYPGQRAPGAAIRGARFELLYGMQADLEYPYLRLSELAGRQGNPAGRQLPALAWAGSTKQQRSAYDGRRKEWADTYAGLLSRLGVFEAYDERQPGGARVQSDLRYTLRQNSKILRNWEDTKAFKGGATWGVEFKNVLEALWRDPKSTSAELANPYFSALGGWGYQKAGFDEDRQKIISTTGMGRVHYYCLERIGRIGVFWNVAKHVIIYERTVAKSKYFDNEQNKHEGRPVLRKVREYIEIMQPERRYPEFGAAPATRGFVLGCEFKTRIINIKSTWGFDVRDEGYQIPLWRVGEKAKFYPKPQVTLHLAGASGESIGVDIHEVEKLCFYSSTVLGTGSDPNRWKAVKEIDYTDLPFAQPPKVEYMSSANPDGKLMEASPVEPGQARFTYAIVPQDRPVNLVAERSTGDTVGAVIRNVTMSRSAALASVQSAFKDQIRGPIEDLHKSIDKTFDDIIGRIPEKGKLPAAARDWLESTGKSKLDELLKSGGAIAKGLGGLDGAAGMKFANINPCVQLKAAAVAPLDLWQAQMFSVTDQFAKDANEAIDAVDSDFDAAKAVALRHLDAVSAQIAQGADAIQLGLGNFEDEMQRSIAMVNEQGTLIQSKLEAVFQQAKDTLGQTAKERTRLTDQWNVVERDLDAQFAQAERVLDGAMNGKAAVVAGKIRGWVTELRITVRDGSQALCKALQKPDLKRIKEQIDALSKSLNEKLGLIKQELDKLVPNFSGLLADVKNLETELKKVPATIKAAVEDSQLNNQVAALKRAIADQGSKLKVEIAQAVRDLKDKVGQFVDSKCKELTEPFINEISSAEAFLNGVLGEKWDVIKELLDKANDQAQQIREGLLDLQREASKVIQGFTDTIEREARKVISGDVAQAADSTLRLVRALGDPPNLNDLVFNRDRVAYYFNELDRTVKTTPMAALVNRAGEQLKAFGLRVPTQELLDRCVPAGLDKYDLSKVLPDFGGLRLDNLFPGVRLPALSNQNVKVSHGSDAQTRRAWMDAKVDVPLDRPATIFSFGPLLLTLRKGEFHAKQRIDVQEGQSPQAKTYGEVVGSWDLQIGGMPLVVFRDTRLYYDGGGGLKFDLSPDRVEVQGALKFLGDLIRQINTRGKGFVVRVKEVDNLPRGIEARLSLPLPNLTFGAFAIMNLQLGAFLDLDATNSDFALGIGFNIGTKLTPFRINVLFLTGGGWFDTTARYLPATGKLTATVTIGIVAGAALEFSFGPIRGGVMVVLGIYGEYTDSSNSLNLSIMLLAQGQVDVAGIVSAYVSVLLEMTYQSATGTLIGRGSVNLSIKICWCFTLNVSTSVEYVFAGSSQKQVDESASNQAVEDYLALTEG